MKVFARVLLSWNEPPFFLLRIRGRKGWMLRLLLFLAIAAAMGVGFYADFRWGQGPARTWGPLRGTLMSLVCALVLTGAWEIKDYRREVSITEDCINLLGHGGHFASYETWRPGDVTLARLARPEELGKPFGMLVLNTQRRQGAIGLPADVPAERVAQVLHGQGVPVVLSGWSPDEAEPAPAQPVAQSAPDTAVRPPSVEVWPVHEPYAGRIRSGQDAATLIGCLPGLLLSVAGLGGMGYALWYRNQLALGEIALYGLGGIALLSLGVRLGTQLVMFVSGRHLLRRAQREISDRPDALVDPRHPDAVLVQVVPRDRWEQGPILKPSDVGFLFVDQPGRRLLFEGDKERWRVPAGCLISCEVERASVHAGRDQNAIPSQFVAVVRASKEGAVWEAPLCCPHLEFRPLRNRDREAKAVALRNAIRVLLPADRPAEASR